MASTVEPVTGRAFDEVYEQEYVGLVRLAHLLTGSAIAGEDLVQEAFALAFRRWGDLVNPASYVRTSVVNGARQWHRRRAVEARLGRRAAGPAVVDADPGDELWDALARLPFRQRAALVLRFYEDRTTDDVATALGCRPATARSLIHRGKAELRKVVER